MSEDIYEPAYDILNEIIKDFIKALDQYYRNFIHDKLFEYELLK